MTKRILFVHDWKMKNFGLDLVARQQIRALTEAGHEVDLLSRGSIELPAVRCITHRYTWANLVSWAGRSIYYDARKRAFASLAKSQLRRSDYDAVISWIGGTTPLLRETRKRGIPLFLNVALLTGLSDAESYGSDHESARFWPRISQAERRSEYIGQQTHVLLPSKFLQQQLVEAGVPGERLHIIERGYDPDKFFPPSRPADTFRLLFCGKVFPRKGVMAALKAWREASLDNAEFWLVGRIAPDHQERYREAATGSVRFMGFESDPGEVMRQCHAQILLSFAEGQAKSLIEGAACGLVTIATAATGFPFERGDLGFEVAANDIDGIVTILRRLHADHEFRQRLSANSADIMREHYQWASFRQRLVKAVESAL
jgi:glycosyltransferase involved in cell wall biosynthesis